VAGNQQWRQHVLQQFRQAKDVDAGQQQRLLLIAQEYADLINNIAHHQVRLSSEDDMQVVQFRPVSCNNRLASSLLGCSLQFMA